jgi:hypothetical protein
MARAQHLSSSHRALFTVFFTDPVMKKTLKITRWQRFWHCAVVVRAWRLRSWVRRLGSSGRAQVAWWSALGFPSSPRPSFLVLSLFPIPSPLPRHSPERVEGATAGVSCLLLSPSFYYSRKSISSFLT